MFQNCPAAAVLLIVCGVLLSTSSSEGNVQLQALRYRRRTPDTKCGLPIVEQDEIMKLKRSVTNATSSKKITNFPWLAAIYYKTDDDKWEQQCQGVLITPHLVLSAAHCMMKFDNTQRQPETIRVGLGKYYRDYYRSERSSIISEVKEMVVSSQYLGQRNYLNMDIALLDLVDRVQTTDFIMPVCVDWSHNLRPTSGAVVHAGAWGLLDNFRRSETVETAQLNFTGYEECLKNINRNFHRYLSPHKFCTKYINAESEGSLERSSGSGVTYVKNGFHFLIGVLSAKIQDTLQNNLLLSINITHGDVSSWLETEKHRLEQSHSK